MKRYTVFMLMCVLSLAVSCDKPDVTEPDDKQEQTGNSGNENEGGNENEDGTGNENGETPSEGEGEGETEKVKSMTITLEKLTATKAYFKASTKKTAPDIEIGIYYSQYAGDHIYDCERVWDYDLENGECELVIKGLDANTTYYYRPYLFINGTRELGDELSFTTPEPSITVDEVIVNGLEVTFKGYADLDGEGGIIFSSIKGSNTLKQLKCPVEQNYDGTYTVSIDNLSCGTTHYYSTYYYDNKTSTYVYGQEEYFTTPEPSISIDDVQVNGNIVTFIGSSVLDVEGGILYSDNSDVSTQSYLGNIKLNNYCGTFQESIGNLSYNKTYYYCSYMVINGIGKYSTVNSFSVGEDAYISAIKDLSSSSAENLSQNGTANCYIVSQSGLYKIRTVKGNSNESVGAVSTPAILWETFGTSDVPKQCDLITGVCYKDGYVIFQTNDVFKEGNAVIGAKDDRGNVLWSWHIWLTDEPLRQVYKNNAGTMMDRNLGATSATPGDVKAMGLFYQWGRKDPFLGSSSISDGVEAKSTITWPPSVDSNTSYGTIEYANANPTTFIAGNRYNHDWYYTGSSSTDKTRWTESDKMKSIYDPCPVGWRVPDGGPDVVWATAGFDAAYHYDSGNRGFSFSTNSPSDAWYPNSGCRHIHGPASVGYEGSYWACSYDKVGGSDNYYAHILSLHCNENGGGVLSVQGRTCENGCSVRCLKE